MDNFNDLVKIDGMPFQMPPKAKHSDCEMSLMLAYVSSFVAPDAAFAKLRNFFGNYLENSKFHVLGSQGCFETKRLEVVPKLQESRMLSLSILKSNYIKANVEHNHFIVFAFEDLNLHFKNCAIINLAIKDWQNKLTEVLRARGQQNS